MAEISSTRSPDKSTIGSIGDICVNSISGKRYKLIAVHHLTTAVGSIKEYEWARISDDNGGYGNSHIHNNQGVLDRLNASADGTLQFDGNDIKAVSNSSNIVYLSELDYLNLVANRTYDPNTIYVTEKSLLDGNEVKY